LTNENYRLENINNSSLLPSTDTHHEPIILFGNNRESPRLGMARVGVEDTSLDLPEITFKRRVLSYDQIKTFNEIQSFHSYDSDFNFNKNLDDMAYKMVNCGRIIAHFHCVGCGVELYKRPLRCYQPFCCECSRKVFGRFYHRIENLLQKYHFDLKMVTLTSNLSPISKNVDYLREQFHKLEHKIKWRGSIYCFESGEHGHKLHIHAIVVSKYINQKKLSNLWDNLTGFPIVFIQKVNSIDNAVKYIAGYVAKPNILFLAYNKKKRKISTTGVFYKIKNCNSYYSNNFFEVWCVNCKQCETIMELSYEFEEIMPYQPPPITITPREWEKDTEIMNFQLAKIPERIEKPIKTHHKNSCSVFSTGKCDCL